jgi:hypothetical protein
VLRLGVREGVEEERGAAEAPAAPARADVEKLGAAQAEDEHRSGDELDDRLHEVEQGRRRPLHVVEHEQQRLLPRKRLEQAAHRPSGLHDRHDGPLVEDRRHLRRNCLPPARR